MLREWPTENIDKLPKNNIELKRLSEESFKWYRGDFKQYHEED